MPSFRTSQSLVQVRTTPTVAFIALVTLWCATIINMSDALSGFNNKSMLAVGVLFVVVSSIERSQIVPWAARVILGTKTSEAPCSNAFVVKDRVRTNSCLR